MKWTNHYIHIYAGRGNLYIKMAHCNQYFCCLYRTVYNKKRSIYKKPIPTVTCQFDFFFFSFETGAKTFFFWEEWVGDINFLSFFLFLFFFLQIIFAFLFSTPNPVWTSRCLEGGVSGCGSFIVVWVDWEGGGGSMNKVAVRGNGGGGGGEGCSSGSGEWWWWWRGG